MKTVDLLLLMFQLLGQALDRQLVWRTDVGQVR
jgi:hypothetical protein